MILRSIIIIESQRRRLCPPAGSRTCCVQIDPGMEQLMGEWRGGLAGEPLDGVGRLVDREPPPRLERHCLKPW